MPDNQSNLKEFFKNLRNLFSRGPIVQHVGKKRLVVKDLDNTNAVSNTSMYTNLADRYNRIATYNKGQQYSNSWNEHRSAQNRYERYTDYEVMDQDGLVSSVLDIYADESTTSNDEGNILRIVSEDDNKIEILENLFYDILNIDFNLHTWIRNMCKYGDFFLALEISPKYGIINAYPYSVYEVQREEGTDNKNPNHVVFTLTNNTADKFEEYEIIHFRLLTDTSTLPYGRSIIEASRRIWKQVQLMEDAMLIYRIMRAPERRIFYVNIGNIPPNEVDNFMQKIISSVKKEPVVDPQTGDVNLRYNIHNVAEDFFFPVRGNEESTKVDTLPGGQNTGDIEDLEFLQRKLFASWKIPKSYLGYEEDLGQKSTLAMEDLRFARTIERVQRVIVAELTKIAIIHLYAQGYENEDLIDFDIELTNPSTAYEIQQMDLLERRINIADTAIERNVLGSEYIYKNLFNFSEKKIEDNEDQMAYDKKVKFRFRQIEEQGNDPKLTGRIVDDTMGPDSGERKLGFTYKGQKQEDDKKSDEEKIDKLDKDNNDEEDLLGLDLKKQSQDNSKPHQVSPDTTSRQFGHAPTLDISGVNPTMAKDLRKIVSPKNVIKTKQDVNFKLISEVQDLLDRIDEKFSLHKDENTQEIAENDD